MTTTIGIVECRSIARGMQAADAMLKAADVRLLRANTVCPGKYIVLVDGEVSAVSAAVEAGMSVAAEKGLDSTVLARIDESVSDAISGVNTPAGPGALGIVELRGIATGVAAADASVKAADVTIVRMRLGGGIGGKSYYLLTGDVAAVTASVEAGASVAAAHARLIDSVVIARPDRSFISQYE